MQAAREKTSSIMFGTLKKRASLLVRWTKDHNDDFSDLPPKQRKRKLLTVIEKLEGEIAQLQEKNQEIAEIQVCSDINDHIIL